MSNKPLKASDSKKLKDLFAKKQKAIETTHMCPEYMYIICEGTKTEPNYFYGLVDEINRKYYRYVSDNRIKVEGTGKNTKGLLEYAREVVKKRCPEAKSVWLVYDKDDFPYDNFDNTQFSAENRHDKVKYHVAWSNECFELWILLHFQEMNSNIIRDEYKKRLDGHFEKMGYGKYEKNIEEIYRILKDKTEMAIKRARKQYEQYGNDPPSKCCPATRVYELVETLQQYLS